MNHVFMEEPMLHRKENFYFTSIFRITIATYLNIFISLC